MYVAEARIATRRGVIEALALVVRWRMLGKRVKLCYNGRRTLKWSLVNPWKQVPRGIVPSAGRLLQGGPKLA